MQEKFTSARLTLNTLQLSDVDFIYELVNTPGWLTFIGNRNIKTTDDATAYINRLLQNPNITYWVVSLTESNIPVGVITFIKRDTLDHPDLGFAFLPTYEAKGYAYEASKIVLDALIAAKKYNKILATTIPDNIRSIHLLARLGFHFDHEINDEKEALRVYMLICD